MDEQIVRWFSNKPITYLNIISLCRIISSDQDSWLSFYLLILNKLLVDEKISKSEYDGLVLDFNLDSNLDIVRLIESVAQNPNLIYPDMWVSNNSLRKSINSCFPCRKIKNN